MWSLYYHELIGKIEEYEAKKYLMTDDNILDQVLNKIKKRIDIAKFDDSKILIDTHDKLSDDIIFKNVAILITCIIKDSDKFYPQLYLEEALVA